MRGILLALVLFIVVPIAHAAEQLSSNDLEVRTVFTFKVSDAAIQKVLPTGWTSNSPTSGPTQGFNLGITLINQTSSQDPDGKPLTPRSYVVLNTPAKKIGTDIAGTMVFDGFMAKDGVPGAYGVYATPAKVTVDRKHHTAPDGKTSVEEVWRAMADDGSALEIQVNYVRGAPSRSKLDAKVFSAAKPDFYRIYRLEQAVDVVRSTASGIDRVTEFSLKANGPKFASLLDGTEQLVSITSIPHYSRAIYLPGP